VPEEFRRPDAPQDALRTETVSMPVPGIASAPQMSTGLRLSMYLRCLASQGSWNYEILVGNATISFQFANSLVFAYPPTIPL
jgi:hypothetical protein